MDELSVLTWRIPRASTNDVETATLPAHDRVDALTRLRDAVGAREMVYIPTCQRVALVLLHAPDDAAQRAVTAYHALGRDLPLPEFHRGRAAFHHLAETAASLDSLVVGEPQILGQVKEAARLSDEAGLSGAGLRHVFNLVLRAAKAVRTDTDLFRGKVSLIPLTEELVDAHLGSRAAAEVAILGTGQIGQRMIDVVKRYPHARIHLVSRTPERAHELARTHNATGHALADLLAAPPARFDVIACAMSTDAPLLREADLERLCAPGALLLDLSVPRNIDPDAHIPSARLVQMDDLSRMSQEAKAARQAEIDHARRILDDQLDLIENAYAERKLAHDLAALSRRFEEVASERLARAAAEGIPLDGPDGRKWFDQTLRALLHEATTTVKKTASQGKR